LSPRIRNNKRREKGEVTIEIRESEGVDDADRRDEGICVYGKSSGHLSEGGGRVNILGINIYHGDASAAILCDGQLLTAAEIYRNLLVSSKNLVKRGGRRS
jgi:hypothetical protein